MKEHLITGYYELIRNPSWWLEIYLDVEESP